MKMPKKLRRARAMAEVRDNFARGFVATGLLAAFQNDGKRMPSQPAVRRVLKMALQGGAALSAGAAAAEALRRNAPFRALGVITAGSLALVLAEHLLRVETPPDTPINFIGEMP